jgi:hypothetical protein
MKKYILFIVLGLFLCSFSINSQLEEPKKYGIVKSNGDTLWYDDLKIKYYGTNHIKYVDCINKSSNEKIRIKAPEGFIIIFPNRPTIVYDTTGYDCGNVEISGKNHILTRRVFDNGLPSYFILKRSFAPVRELTRTKKCVDDLKKYFGDCPEFIQEINLVAKEFDRAKFPFAKFDALIQRYKC